VVAATLAAYETSIQETASEDLPTAWALLDALSGQEVTAVMNSKEVTGIASGIDESGALLLKLPDSGLQKIRAGDVTLKK
jgi:BirA family biotin operon repressor/biotin-[acetyl-CoA-carboxylase] ligase